MNKKYFNPIKNEDVYLREIDGEIYWGNQKLSLMGDEQKLKSKTGANYYFKRESDGIEFYFKLEENNFSLTETVSEKEHSVWLQNKRSLSFYRNDEHIVSRNHNIDTYAVIDKQEANNILNSERLNLIYKEAKKYFNPIKNEDVYLREIDGEIYWGNQKLSLMGDEQKSKSKTGANYYYKRESDGTEFYFKLEENNFSLTETVSEQEHSVWLKNKRSLTFRDSIKDVVYSDNNMITNQSILINKEDAIKIIDKNNKNDVINPKVEDKYDNIKDEKNKNLIISSIKLIREKLFGNNNANENKLKR